MLNDVHVLLVSAQAAPNLLPTLDPGLKPKEAVLVVSKQMQQRAAALKTVLNEAGVPTVELGLNDSTDLQELSDLFLRIAADYDGRSVAVNLTGGNKLMALTAQQVGQTVGWIPFYLDVDSDRVIQIDAPEQEPRQLQTILRLPHYLRAHGLTPEPRTQPDLRLTDAMRALMQTLASQADRLQQAIGVLNGLAASATGSPGRTVQLERWTDNTKQFPELLDLFAAADLIEVDNRSVRFVSEDARRFANGGWLERYVYSCVARISNDCGIQDKDYNLEVLGADRVRNELDVVFLARNRLFLIECKTAKMNRSGQTKANDALFKLAGLAQRVGGLGTRPLLVSFWTFKAAEQTLADALRVKVIAGSGLGRLDDHLRAWIGR